MARSSAPTPGSLSPRALPQPSFLDLGVPAALAHVLATQGLTAAFPIQVATLPDTLTGRDVLGRGRTGSGKTLAFAIPLVARLTGGSRTPRTPRGLVLVPTRELANQVHAVLAPLAQAVGLTTAVVFGGVNQNPQARTLERGVDILVACPGRLTDLCNQRLCDLSGVEVTVLDEADHMADLGFLPVVRRLLDRTPATGQRLLFSATLDNGVDVLVSRYLTRPRTHEVASPPGEVSPMTHHVLAVAAADKRAIVHELAAGEGRSVLFLRTKHTAKKLARELTAAGIPAVDLHGNLSQPARERNLQAFAEGSARVLVATDIAARGIHVDDVALVVHVDPPTEHKSYLHRSGRTARAGAGGVVVTLSLPEEAREVRALTRAAGIQPTSASVTPDAPLLAKLRGPRRALVTPVPAPAQAPLRRGHSTPPRSIPRRGPGRPVPTQQVRTPAHPVRVPTLSVPAPASGWVVPPSPSR